MPKASKAQKPKKKGAAHTQPKLSPIDYAHLQKKSTEKKKQFGRAENTNNSYGGQVKRGQEFVARFAMEQAEADKQWKENGEEAVSGDDDEGDSCDNAPAMLDPDFHKAFDGAPIECTPLAISMFMTHKCFTENRKASTAIAIHAAFLRHYDQMANDTYRGRWNFNEMRQRWEGNPTRSAEVEDMLEACKNKDGEGERNHSRAMSLADMQAIFAYSEKTCPASLPVSDQQALALQACHLFYKAFSSFSWLIWTRVNEATSIQAKHLDFAPPPRPGKPHLPYIKINLRNRKNWQKKSKNGESGLNGHTYNVYAQPNNPAIDLYTHMWNWKEFYETRLLGRKLKPNDYIFPSLGVNGLVAHPHVPVSSDIVQKRINEWAAAAGISGAGHFTTHCFRRGGAQYRFMFAPLGQRWTLARIRWWGGWAVGEHRDTLIRYLLDELYTYEEDHSDALCPVDYEANMSHMGEAGETRPLSASEGLQLFAAQAAEQRRMMEEMRGLINAGPIMPCMHYPPGMPSAPQRHFVSPSPPIFNHQMPGSQSAAINHGPVAYPLQNSSLMNAASAGVGLPIPVEPAAVVPDISRRLGAKAWKQVVRDWEYLDPGRKHFTALKDWKHEWHATSRQSQLWGQRRTITLEFILEYGRDEDLFEKAYPDHEEGITALLQAIRAKGQAEGKILTRKRRKAVD